MPSLTGVNIPRLQSSSLQSAPTFAVTQDSTTETGLRTTTTTPNPSFDLANVQTFGVGQSPYGRGVNSGQSTDATLQGVFNSRNSRTNQFVLPAIDKQIGELDSTELIDDAKANAETAFDGAEAQTNRELSRRGIRMTPAQIRAFQRRQNLDSTLNAVGNVSDARTKQTERNTALAADLSNKGQGLNNVALQSLAGASARDTSRSTTNSAIDANHRNSQIQTATGLTGLGIAAYAAGLL